MDNGNNGLTFEQVTEILRYICHDADTYKDYLNELDSAIGDSDLGITISRGFKAVLKTLDNQYKNIGQLITRAGMDFNSAASSTMGVLFGMALMNAGLCVGDSKTIDLNTFHKMIVATEEAIMNKGKAELGEKTIIDAIEEVRLSLKKSIDCKLTCRDAVERAYQASLAGCEATRGMQALRGRSHWLGERTIGHLDPGAAFFSLIMKSINEYFKRHK